MAAARVFRSSFTRLLAAGCSLGFAACVNIVETRYPAETTAAPATPDLSPAPVDPGLGDRMPSGRDFASRSAVVAPRAAAATAHPLATQTALDIMKAGGSAVDAAIAANAMLGLVEPTGNGIGGDLFAIVWDPATEKLYGYNGSGRSPMGASLADIQAIADTHGDGTQIPKHGSAPVSVPGTVDGWFALHEKFGAHYMSYNLRPAIEYARTGAPIPEVIAYYWGRNEAGFRASYESGMLEEFDNARALYFDPSPEEGALYINEDLANTLQAVADGGRDAFYKGQIAETIDFYMTRIGGALRYEDMAAHEGEWVEPICIPYRETRVCQLPPNTQGVAALQMLQMLEDFPMGEFGYASPDSLMAQIEAKRLAFVDRALNYADPAFSNIDPETFIDEDYVAALGASIDLTKANPDPMGEVIEAKNTSNERQLASVSVDMLDLQAADATLADGDTTYLSVVDENGMMVSLIQSNYRGMGSGLVPDGLGFMLQDRGELFSLDPNHPNVYAPGKRPFHTIIPAFAFKRDTPNCAVRAEPFDQACPYQPWLTFGLMGGGMQPQGHVQVILNLIDHGMGLQEAGDAARWEHVGGCEPTDAADDRECREDIGVVRLESGIPPAARAELEARGHTVECCQANGGGYQAIMRDFRSGAWIAATEMRKDGAADGY